MFLALAFSIYLVPLFVAAVDAVDDTYLKTAYTLGASEGPGGEPGAAADLLARHLAGDAPRLRRGLELHPARRDGGRRAAGSGGIIITSQRRGPREHIYLVLVAIVLVAFLTDKLWAAVGRLLFPYREAEAMSDAPAPPVIEFKGRHQDVQPGQPAGSSPRSRTSASAIDDIPDYGEFIAIVGPLGLRQVDDPEPDPGLRRRLPADHGRGAGARAQGDRARPRPRHDLPEVQLVSAPHACSRTSTFGLELNQDELRLVGLGAPGARPRVDPEGRPWRTRAGSTRTSSRADSSSGWRSRARWCSSRRSS